MKRVLVALALAVSLSGCCLRITGRPSCADLVLLRELIAQGGSADTIGVWVDDTFSGTMIANTDTNTIAWEKNRVVYRAELEDDRILVVYLDDIHMSAGQLVECLGAPALYSAIRLPGRWGRGHDVYFGLVFPESGVVAGSYRRFNYGSVNKHSPNRSWLLDGIRIVPSDTSSVLLNQRFGVGGSAEDYKALFVPWPDDWDDIEVVEWLAR